MKTHAKRNVAVGSQYLSVKFADFASDKLSGCQSTTELLTEISASPATIKFLTGRSKNLKSTTRQMLYISAPLR